LYNTAKVIGYNVAKRYARLTNVAEWLRSKYEVFHHGKLMGSVWLRREQLRENK